MRKKRKLKAKTWLAKDKVQMDIALEFNDEKLLNKNARKRFPNYVLEYLWDEAEKHKSEIPPPNPEQLEKLHKYMDQLNAERKKVALNKVLFFFYKSYLIIFLETLLVFFVSNTFFL